LMDYIDLENNTLVKHQPKAEKKKTKKHLIQKNITKK
jgi:hypothetical protein